MADQLRIDGVPESKVRHWKGGYARPPGTGPAGETCGSCRHFNPNGGGGGGRYFKCRLVQTTHGPGTDIRKRAPACELWAAPREPVACIACGAELPEERRSHPWCQNGRCWAEANGETPDWYALAEGRNRGD